MDPPIKIESARSWLSRRDLKATVAFLEETKALVSIELPFRITCMWGCEPEEVYVEAVMPVDDDTLSNVAVGENKEFRRGSSKAVGFLVRLKDYFALCDIQKQRLESIQQDRDLNPAESALIQRFDKEHGDMASKNWPDGAETDTMRADFAEKYLTTSGTDTSNEGIMKVIIRMLAEGIE